MEEKDRKYPEKQNKEKVILYNFYKKKMANKIPSMQASVAPEGQKVATCTQEIIRRYKNTSRSLPPTIITNILKEYMDELKAGGFSQLFREKVLDAATIGT